MKMSHILNKDSIIAEIGSKDKEGAINELALVMSKTAKVKAENIARVLMERESLGSTGIGEGIAIPHCQMGVDGSILMGLGISRQGIEYDSLDKKPAHIFFLLIIPEDSIQEHVKVLARISKLLKMEDFKKSLKAAQSVEDIYQIIMKQDEEF